MRRVQSFMAIAELLGVLGAGSARAQEFRATLSGRVVDQSDAVVPGVAVNLTNVDTNVSLSTVSTEHGGFVFPPLIPGTYRVTAELAGFKRFVRDGIVLRVQDKVDLVIALEVGDVTTSVEVQQQLSRIQTATATIGQGIEARLISELPLNGRNPYLLAGLSTGVLVNNPPAIQRTFDVGGTNSITTGAGPSRRGGGNNEFILDGAPAEGALNFVPSVSATQEFKVQTNTFDAEYGRAAGAVVNVSVKSGTNGLRGEAYEFHRNSALDANSFFGNRSGLKKSNFLFHLFGASVGGPVRLPGLYNGKDRTFFFFNYEGVRQGTPSTYLSRVPTELERNGDFSRSFNTRGELVAIYDALNPTRNADGTFTRMAFADNRIPASRFDPVAQKMIGYYPAPSLAGETPLGTPNFARAAGDHDDYDQYVARMDHNVTSRNQLFVRIETSARTDVALPLYGNQADLGGSGAPFSRVSRGGAVQDTHTFGANSVLTVRYGYNRLVNRQALVHEGFDFRTLGLPESLYQAVTRKMFPEIVVDGFSGLAGTGAFLSASDGHTTQANFSKIVGRHILKVGADLRAARFNQGNTNFGAASGSFSFDAAFTQGPNPNIRSDRAGHPIASLLLGTPASGRIDNNAEAAFQSTYYGMFAHNDFRVTSRLTLNAGLRWEYETPLTERFNRMTRGFDFTATSPVQPPGMTVHGGLLFSDANNRSIGSGDAQNLAPRLGLAYRLGSRTAVRAGYGIFYGKMMSNYASSAVQPGFSATTSFVSSLDGGITPANYLRDPFPQGLVPPTGSALGLATLVGQAISFVDPNLVQPYSQNFTLNIQHELPAGLLIEAGYVGSRGSHLPWTNNLEVDQLPPSLLVEGTRLQDRVTNPFFGLIRIGALSASTVARQQLLRPYPQFTSVRVIRPNIGNASYHSLQAKVERRFAQGLAFLTSYTLSKLIDDVAQNVTEQNYYNLRQERSLSEYDRTHRLVTTWLCELPFGRGKRFLNRAGAVGKLAGGWQLNAIYQLQSGGPLALRATPTTTLFGGGLRPIRSPGSVALEGPVQDRLNRYFNTALFSGPAPFTFGNTARTLSDVREPRLNLVDFSAIKNTPITERITVQLRAEAFNLFNHPIFRGPATTVGSATLGQVTSTFGSPRQLQFALKVIF